MTQLCVDRFDTAALSWSVWPKAEPSRVVTNGPFRPALNPWNSNLVAAIVGLPVRLRFDTFKPDGTPRKLLDVGRLSALGWRPSFTLEEGVRRTCEWFVSHHSKVRG